MVINHLIKIDRTKLLKSPEMKSYNSNHIIIQSKFWDHYGLISEIEIIIYVNNFFFTYKYLLRRESKMVLDHTANATTLATCYNYYSWHNTLHEN